MMNKEEKQIQRDLTYKDYIYRLFNLDPEVNIINMSIEDMYTPIAVIAKAAEAYGGNTKVPASMILEMIIEDYNNGRREFYANIYFLMKKCISIVEKYFRNASDEEKETDEFKHYKEIIKIIKRYLRKDLKIGLSTYCIYRIVDETDDDDKNWYTYYESPEMITQFGNIHKDDDPVYNYNEHFYNKLLEMDAEYNFTDYDECPYFWEYRYSTLTGKRIDCESMVEHYYNL